MTSKKKTAANRRNARKSSGPKTAAGKARASMNAVRHGLRARTVVLPSENREDFDEILTGLQDQYQPQNKAELYLVDQAAIAQWKLVRAEVFEADCYVKEASPQARAAILDRMTQVTSRIERAYFKAYKELERIKTAREKQAEQSEQPEQPEQPEQSQGKKEKFKHPPKLEVAWVRSDTGEREVFYRSEYGKPVKEFSDTPPSS